MKKNILIISLLVNFIVLCFAIFMIIKRQKYMRPDLSFDFNKVKINNFKSIPIDSNVIIFVGDSHTEFFHINELTKKCNIINRGIAGELSSGLIARLSEITQRNPEKIFIQTGFNDLLYNVKVDSLKANLKIIISKIKKESPRTVIYYQSIFPSSIKNIALKKFDKEIENYNNFLRQYCHENNVTYIDVYTKLVENHALNLKYDAGDHVHLNGLGYKIWASSISPYL